MSPTRAQELLQAPGLAVLGVGSVLVQVRVGALTAARLEEIAAIIRKVVQTTPGPWGYLSVLAEGSPLPDASLRRAQRNLIRTELEGRDARVAVLIEGSGVVATLARAAARLIVPGHGAIRIAQDVQEAVEWIGGLLRDVRADDVRQAVERGRQLASQQHPPA